MSMNIWNVDIAEEQKDRLVPAILDDKDILTDFDYLHSEEFIEQVNPNNDNEYQIAFYNNGCLWVITYIYGCETFRLKCLYKTDKELFKTSLNDIIERVVTDFDENNQLVIHFYELEDKDTFEVEYYHIDD